MRVLLIIIRMQTLLKTFCAPGRILFFVLVLSMDQVHRLLLLLSVGTVAPIVVHRRLGLKVRREFPISILSTPIFFFPLIYKFTSLLLWSPLFFHHPPITYAHSCEFLTPLLHVDRAYWFRFGLETLGFFWLFGKDFIFQPKVDGCCLGGS